MIIKKTIKKYIPNIFFKRITKIYRKIEKRYSKKISYSQCGEDIIIDFLLTEVLKIKNVSYLDLGAHHSSFLSNTYYFYKKKFSGVLVEPDIYLFNEIRKRRPKDCVLNFGVGISNKKESDFFIFDTKELNTFSPEIAKETKQISKLEKIAKVQLVNINDISEKYCKNCPSFISIDIEGLDLDIINTLNFKKWRPPVICIETIRHSNGQKIKEITDTLIMNNYKIYADTYINTIYVDNNLLGNIQK